VNGYRGWRPSFPIYANHLLLAGDDPGLNNGRDVGGINQTIDGDTLMREASERLRESPDHAADLDALPKAGTRYVRSATGIKGFALHFDDRCRSFRGNPRPFPDEFIQHGIADYQQPLLCPIKKLYSSTFIRCGRF
jgi:hypothetical protein